MAEVLTQVAGMGKEVAVAYILMYGIIEILKIIVFGVVGWKGLVALAKFISIMP